MADTLTTYTGRGPEGDFSIDLPNWARETTQVKIDKKLGDLNKNFKNLPKDMQSAFENALKKNVGALNKLADQNKKEATKTAKRDQEEQRNRSKTQQAEAALLNATLQNAQAIQDLEKITNENNTGGGSLANLVSKAGPFGKIFQVLTKGLGMLAGVIKGVATAMLGLGTFIGNELMKTFNLLNRSLSDGTGMLMGAFTDSTVNVAAEAAKAGMGLTEFTDALAENSEEIRVLGTQGFRELRNAVRDNIGGMFDLGYSQEEITQLLGREISIRQRLGMRLDLAGNELEDDILLTSREVRRLSNAAGVNAEVLYEAAKLTDETNTLISARARQFGNQGISQMFTSFRELSLRISALAPTYGSQITSPLVNAITTGAIGLDDEFTQLVTVFPGLVKTFEMGRADIMNGGKLTEETITSMMDSLIDVSEEDFERAKMLALMTRNQTAIQAVNFANEARAREGLIKDINDQGLADRIRSAGTISQQASQFFDIMKAPFETGIANFILSVLGVNTAGGDINMANVVEQFTILASKFLSDLPVFGKFFDGNFFNDLNQAVSAYFDDNATSTDREEARKRINTLVTQTISDIGDGFNEVLSEGTLGATISDFFRKLFDELTINIYEATGAMGEAAFMAYMRKGDIARATEVDTGMIASYFGLGGSAGEAVITKTQDKSQDLASRYGVDADDVYAYMAAGGATEKGKKILEDSSLKNLSGNALDTLVMEMMQFQDIFGPILSKYDGKGNKVQKGLEDGDEELLNLVYQLADPNSRLNRLVNLDYKTSTQFATDFRPNDQVYTLNDAGMNYLNKEGLGHLKDADYIAGLVDSFYRDVEQNTSTRADKLAIVKDLVGLTRFTAGPMGFQEIIADRQISDEELAALGLTRTAKIEDGKVTGYTFDPSTVDPNSDIGVLFQNLGANQETQEMVLQKLAILLQKIDPNSLAAPN